MIYQYRKIIIRHSFVILEVRVMMYAERKTIMA